MQELNKIFRFFADLRHLITSIRTARRLEVRQVHGSYSNCWPLHTRSIHQSGPTGFPWTTLVDCHRSLIGSPARHWGFVRQHPGHRFLQHWQSIEIRRHRHPMQHQVNSLHRFDVVVVGSRGLASPRNRFPRTAMGRYGRSVLLPWPRGSRKGRSSS